MKSKIILTVLLIATFSFSVYAQEDAVIFSYERAVELALENMLALQDINRAIAEMQTQRGDLYYDITSMRRGTFAQKAIQALHDDLWRLDANLRGTSQLMQNAEHELAYLLESMANAEANTLVFEIQTLIQNILTTQGMGQNIAQLETQRFAIFHELNMLQDSRNIQRMINSATHSLAEIDRSMEYLRIQREQTELSMENLLRGIIVSLLEQDMQIDSLEIEIVIAEENFRRATILHELGLQSNNELRAARQNLANTRLRLEESHRNRYNLEQNLNLLLGEPASQNTLIQFEFEPLPDDFDLCMEIIPQSAVIRQLQLTVDGARQELQFFNAQLREFQQYNFQPETNQDRAARRSLQENYSRAVNGRNQEILAKESSLRRIFSDIENLNSRMESQLTELETAIEQHDIARTNYEQGRATQLDVTIAELEIIRTQQSIKRLYMQKWTLLFIFENPSLL
jgi:hypothetical protein